MAYVPPEYAEVGREIQIEIRGRQANAQIVNCLSTNGRSNCSGEFISPQKCRAGLSPARAALKGGSTPEDNAPSATGNGNAQGENHTREDGHMYPPEFLYTKDHEWIMVDESVGPSASPITRRRSWVMWFSSSSPSRAITWRQRSRSDGGIGQSRFRTLLAVSGEVKSVNSKLQNNPELVNTDPHGDAWLIRVQLTDRREIDKLMTADEYEAYIQQEKAH